MTSRLPPDALPSGLPRTYQIQLDEAGVRMLGTLVATGLLAAAAHNRLELPAARAELAVTAGIAYRAIARQPPANVEKALVPMFVAIDAPPGLIEQLRLVAHHIYDLEHGGSAIDP